MKNKNKQVFPHLPSQVQRKPLKAIYRHVKDIFSSKRNNPHPQIYRAIIMHKHNTSMNIVRSVGE
jgi:hypothetical protein